VPGGAGLRGHQNYRSTGVIVALSNALAAPLDMGRDSWTRSAQGAQARVYTASDELDEARFVAARIRALLAFGQIDHPGEVAVLFRANAQARVIALMLRAAGVRYSVRRDADLCLRRPRCGMWSPIFDSPIPRQMRPL